MALTRTTLTAPITPNQILLPVASTSTGFPAIGVILNPPQPVQIDDEMMFLVQVPALNTILVRNRGSDGTQAVAHDVNSSVVTSAAPSDFSLALAPGTSTQRPVDAPDIVTYGQSGAIAVPFEPFTMAKLAAPTAGAYTLAAPSVAFDGIIIKLTSLTAAGHTVTTGTTGVNGLFNTGATGGPFGVCTFPAFAGASVELMAAAGLWNVIAIQPPTSGPAFT